MARANVQGTGVFITDEVRQLTGLQWKSELDDHRSVTAPVVQGSVVYFGGRDGSLHALDAADGTQKWDYQPLDNTPPSAPAVAGNTVFYGAGEEFYALRTDTGAVRWIFQPERGSDDLPYIDPLVEDGVVYFGGWHYFHALDIETGQENWKVRLSGVTRSVPTVYDGIVYVGTFSPDTDRDGYLYAFDAATGQEKWKLRAAGGGIGGAVAVTDGVVYVGTREVGLLALDAKSGQEKWRYSIELGLTTAPAVANGRVYITDRGTCRAIDAQTGKEHWDLQTGSDFNTDPVIAGGIIYFGSTTAGLGVIFGGKPSGYIHAVDALTGHELWTFKVEGSISGAPAVADGTIYFGSEGTLYAVK